jgi:integrase
MRQSSIAWTSALFIGWPCTPGRPSLVPTTACRAGVREDPRFHNLRDTCATLLLGEGVNAKVVSEMLGHASITITLNTYSHVFPHMQDSAADAMEAVLS